MSNELKFPGGARGPEEDLGPLLQPLYQAPPDGPYWDDLHSRILHRVLSAAPDDIGEWWLVLSRWARVGAAAAVVVAILAGALLLQFEGRDARLAYEAVLSQPAAYSLDMSTHTESNDPDAPVANPILRYGLP